MKKILQKPTATVLVLAFILALVLPLLSACTPSEKYEFTQEVDVSFIEPFSPYTLNYEPGYATTTAYAEYLFSSDMVKKTAVKFIDSQEAIYNYLIQNGIIAAEGSEYFGIKYYLLASGYQSRVEQINDAVFIGEQDVGTFRQVLLTLEVMTQQLAHYGLLYGLANLIAAELGMKTEKPHITAAKIKEYTELPVNLDYLDLVYPCFLETFASKDRLPYSARISCDLAAFAVARDGISSVLELLRLPLETFGAAYTTLINAYLASIGSRTVLQVNTLSVFYGFCSKGIPLLYMTERAVFYQKIEYTETTAAYGNHAMWAYYDIMKTILGDINAKFTAAEENVGAVKIERGRPIVMLCSINEVNSNLAGAEGYYSDGVIKACTVMALLHEYILHLTVPSSDTYKQFSWQYQAAAFYIDRMLIEPTETFKNGITANTYYYDMIVDYFGRAPISKQEFLTVYDLIVCENALYDFSETASISLTSFVNYLHGNYAPDKVKNALIHPETVQNHLGKTWTGLQEAWENFISSTFSEYFGNKQD